MAIGGLFCDRNSPPMACYLSEKTTTALSRRAHIQRRSQLWRRGACAGRRKAGAGDLSTRKVAVAKANATTRAASHAVGLDTLDGITSRDDCPQQALAVDYRQLADVSSVGVSTDNQVTRGAGKCSTEVRAVAAAVGRMSGMELSRAVELSHRHVCLHKPAGRAWQPPEIGINLIRSTGRTVGIPDLDVRIIAVDARDSFLPGIAQAVFYAVDDERVPASNRDHRDKQVTCAH